MRLYNFIHMKDPEYQYDLTEVNDGPDINFLFLSQCSVTDNAIVKVIQYARFMQPNGQLTYYDNRVMYNFGFGDYDAQSDDNDDATVTGNKDAYRVFNTVLGTVPLFFEKYPSAAVMVQGSDSRPEFEMECRKRCKKLCSAGCRKVNQRITIYCNFVSKNLQSLRLDYEFIGGTKNSLTSFHFEYFIPYKKYDSVVVYRK